jgi:small subunit ribosomal protein S20
VAGEISGILRFRLPACPHFLCRARTATSARAGHTPDQPDQNFSEGTRVANIKSQIKRNKQNEKARVRNKAVKSSLKTSVRQFREAADAGDAEKVTQTMQAALTKLDKAASKGVIHKNQAANRKSAIAKRAAQVKQG